MARASEQPTHAPTPRRLSEARRRGEVAQSPELGAALALAATFAVLAALAPSIAGQLRATFTDALSRAAQGDPFGAAAARALDSGGRILAAPLAVAFAVPLLVGWMQTGGLWRGPTRAALGRLSPAAAWRRTGAGSGAAARGAVGVLLLLGVGAATLGPSLPRLASLAGAPAPRLMAVLGAAAWHLGVRLVGVALVLGAANQVWASLRHRRRLRMTRREIDRERRELEGDPLQRRERRRLHAALGEVGVGIVGVVGVAGGAAAAAGDRAEARRADLVITGDQQVGEGGGAVAVALRYEPGGDRAPVVLVAARRAAAARLCAEARAAGVPIFGDAALALALGGLAPGAEIPARAYEAVATFLSTAQPGHEIVGMRP